MKSGSARQGADVAHHFGCTHKPGFHFIASGLRWLDGLLPLDEMKDKLGLSSLPEEDLGNYHTVGGFVITAVGRIPKKAETFDWNGWRFEVVDMDKNRVDEVFARPISPIMPSD